MSDVNQTDERIIAELDLCQGHLSASYGKGWQSGGIIMAGAMATLALTLQIDASKLAAATITSAFGVGASYILWLWVGSTTRETAFQRVLIRRMRELEASLRMRRQTLIRLFDDCARHPDKRTAIREELTVTERADFDEVFGRLRSKRWLLPFSGGTTAVLDRTAYLIMLGWIAVAAWRWLIYLEVLD